MLKGLAITPPVLGRISIGKVVEKNGKRLPEKDDQFTITSQIQVRDNWLMHPIDEELRKAQGGKIRSIPVRLLFNAPDLNFRAEYCLFDRQTGRPLCVGNGESCKRRSKEGIDSLPCPSPDGCPLAIGGACKPYGRLNVAIGDEDTLGSFVFRTTGFNSIRTLAARPQYLQAISGDRLACLPLELHVRGKSTQQSHGLPIFYVDITVRSGMSMDQALQHAREIEEARKQSGFDQNALDAAARLGFANGAFEESEEEGEAIVEELFPEPPNTTTTSPTTADALANDCTRPTLTARLRDRAKASSQQLTD
ncbi:hydrolase or metal-binding protein [Pseudomonas aeruginosa]